jgi:integrase
MISLSPPLAIATSSRDLGARTPGGVTPTDVQRWINDLPLKPSSVRAYLGTLRLILDHAGLDPNPARHRSVRLPRQERVQLQPPSSQDVALLLASTPARHRLSLQVLAETGLRAGELHALEWMDVDGAGSRFRIRHGKTALARRWVAVPPDLMAGLTAVTPPDDRTPTRRVFPGSAPDVLGRVMRRACVSAGIAHYTPHSLRHRYASVMVARGVPITNIAAQLGHSHTSMTLDTYSHVLLEADDAV